MQAFEKPLAAVVDRFRLFIATPEIRALHIQADSRALPTAAGLLVALETKGGNRAPVLLLVTPAHGEGHWRRRALELRAQYERLADAARDAEIALPPLPPSTDERDPLTAFALTLGAVRSAMRAPLTAPIVLVVPSSRAEASLASELALLFTTPALEGMRWIVLEPSTRSRAAITGLGDAGAALDALVDPSTLASDLDALAAMSTKAAASSDPTRPIHSAGAGPGVAPPRRPHEREHRVDPDQLRALGVDPASLDVAKGARLRAAVLAASAAALRGDHETCVLRYRDARDVSLESGAIAQAVSFELAMAATALPHAPTAALTAFASAAKRAADAGLGAQAAQAELGHGAALMMSKRLHDAQLAYARASAHGRESAPQLAIEALRMLGTLLAREGREVEASNAWRDALRIAEGADELVAKASSAALAARALAELCARYRMFAQAEALLAEARTLEAPPSAELATKEAYLESIRRAR